MFRAALNDSIESLEVTETGNAFQTVAAACTKVQSQSYSAISVLNKGVAARRALRPGRCVNLHALLQIGDSSTHSTTW